MYSKTFSRKTETRIPGARGWPLIGQTIPFLRDPIGFLNCRQARYGDVFRMLVFGMEVIVLAGAEANRQVLVREGERFPNRAFPHIADKLFPNAVLFSEGEKHRRQRNLLKQAFRKDALRGYLPEMERSLAGRLEGWKGGGAMRVYPEMKALTLDMAGRIFYGLELLDNDRQWKRPLERVLHAGAALPLAIPFTPYWRGLRARKQLVGQLTQLVAARRAQGREDLVSRLCRGTEEAGRQLSDTEMVDQLIFFLVAAHDTTSSALTSLFFLLGRHPEWQDRLRVESRHFYAQGRFAYERMGELPLLQQTFSEALRLYPPLVVYSRRAEAAAEVNGYRIPAGSRVFVLPHFSQTVRGPWENPAVFDPTRFRAPAPEVQACPHAYIPFGAGAHFCLGYGFAQGQVLYVMSTILARYRWRLLKEYAEPFYPFPFQWPRDGLWVEILKNYEFGWDHKGP